MTPDGPFVPTLGQSRGVIDAVFREHLVEITIPRSRQHVVLADTEPEQFEVLVGLLRVAEEFRVDLIGLAGHGATHYRDVSEEVWPVEGDVDRLSTAHREPRNRAIIGLLGHLV